MQAGRLRDLGGRSKYSGISSLLSNSNSCENGTHSPRYVAWRSSRSLSLVIWALCQVQMLWPLPLFRRSEEREAPEVIPLRTLKSACIADFGGILSLQSPNCSFT